MDIRWIPNGSADSYMPKKIKNFFRIYPYNITWFQRKFSEEFLSSNILPKLKGSTVLVC